jgi:hypothetical protein
MMGVSGTLEILLISAILLQLFLYPRNIVIILVNTGVFHPAVIPAEAGIQAFPK